MMIHSLLFEPKGQRTISLVVTGVQTFSLPFFLFSSFFFFFFFFLFMDRAPVFRPPDLSLRFPSVRVCS